MIKLICDKCDRAVSLGGALTEGIQENFKLIVKVDLKKNGDLVNWGYIDLYTERFNLCPTHVKEYQELMRKLDSNVVDQRLEYLKT